MGIITFDGKSSNDYGIEVVAPPRYIIPAEDADFNHLKGKTGDRVTSWKSYKNVTAQYTCNFILDRMMPKPGDANLDKSVTTDDTDLIDQFLNQDDHDNQDDQSDNAVYHDLGTRGYRAADVNSDGVVDSSDNTAISNSFAHVGTLPNSYSAENFFGVVSDSLSDWLKPFYSKNEIAFMLKKAKLTGIFKTDKDGYFRLEDSYWPAVYRKAIISSDISVDNLYSEGGGFTLSANCDPRKFYKVGEEWIDANVTTKNAPTIDYTNGEVLTDTHWRGPGLNRQDTQVLHVNNHLRYPASPIVRLYLTSADLTTNGHRANILQFFFRSDRGPVSESRPLKFDIEDLNLEPQSDENQNGLGPIILFVDFATCDAYYICASKSDFERESASENAFNAFVNSKEIYSFNDRVTTEHHFTTDTGILLPGENQCQVVLFQRTESGSVPGSANHFYNYELMPRWWTL